MNLDGWLLLGLFLSVVSLLTKPMGSYLVRVLDPSGRTPFDAILKPLERWTYRLMGVRPEREQDWVGYAGALLGFSLVGCLVAYMLLRLQHVLPLNPQGLGPVPPHVAFNTAVSFVTNTNWQCYAGESTLSQLSQMVALALPNFTSAATGIGVAAALVRGIAAPGRGTVGNFWADLVRVTYYLLLPLCLVYAVFLVSQGVVQNFGAYTRVVTLEGASQVLPRGPVASQVAIKMLGTNGGGYLNANAAHPFENPTPLSNFVQMVSVFAVGSGLTWYLGRRTQNPGHGWSVWLVMMLLFVGGVLACAWAEAAGNPAHHALGLDPRGGNMEGKEVRFGIGGSSLFAVITTAASCGAVNAMHGSFTPLGGLVLMVNMLLGEVLVGGVGSGLYGMVVFVVLAVFIAGLMVGRTPEYLGKRIRAREIKMALLTLVVPCFAILGFAAWAAASDWGRAGVSGPGPHGFSEILYACTSAAANNGSAFGGLAAGSPPYAATLGIAMLLGRFWMIIPLLALAGSLACQKPAPADPGAFPVAGGTFVLLLLGTILLVGALTFVPVLVLGPVAEHYFMRAGRLF